MSANMSSTTARRAHEGADAAESMARTIDEPVKRTTGLSVFHWLTIGSIGASIALFLAGKKNLAIFIGLWPPTFQALKAASENKQAREL
ncbi:MAG TPA: hypothetical protein VLD57_12620 [Blastocatellia bacterium]|nr:hypothetical protein [Blastocatellia bacterium]